VRLVDVRESRAHLVGRTNQQGMVCIGLGKNPAVPKTVADRFRRRALARPRQAIDKQHALARDGTLHRGASRDRKTAVYLWKFRAWKTSWPVG
jgi:hypothetical protein